MREIKFRAWDKDTGSWIYSDHTKGSMSWFWDMIEEYNCEIMQFTGLKDKNGTEIYEGDVVNGNGKEPDYIVEFSDGCFRGNEINGWDIMVNHFPLSKSVTNNEAVIGNIWDNPELLGGTQKAPDLTPFSEVKNDSSN